MSTTITQKFFRFDDKIMSAMSEIMGELGEKTENKTVCRLILEYQPLKQELANTKKALAKAQRELEETRRLLRQKIETDLQLAKWYEEHKARG